MERITDIKHEKGESAMRVIQICEDERKFLREIGSGSGNDDILSLKALIVQGLRGMDSYAWQTVTLGYKDNRVDKFFTDALKIVEHEGTLFELMPYLEEIGSICISCMEMRHAAILERFGEPQEVKLPSFIEKGPFIIFCGHDMRSLELLLEQTAGKNVNVYTQGDMLTAHAYPGFRKYPHFRGHYGTEWIDLDRSIDIPAPIVFTSDCQTPDHPVHSERIFTTDIMDDPDIPYLGDPVDFAPVIEKAIELKGYPENREAMDIKAGKEFASGYGSRTAMALSEKIIAAVRKKKVSRVYFVIGNDEKKELGFYEDFFKKAPQDSLFITNTSLKYGLYRLDPGTVYGLPRIMDVGWVDDVYGTMRIASETAGKLKKKIGDLPFSFLLSWYKQKTVCILQTLLKLCFGDILMGPSMPDYISPFLLDYLEKNFGVTMVGSGKN